jgi:putative hemolysin
VSLYVVLLVISLFVATFAAAAETSLTSVSRLRMRTLAEEGDKRARRVVALHTHPNQYLSTILTLNTAAVTVATAAATLLAVTQNSHVNDALVTGLLTAFLLVFCEIAPKSLALRFNERVALMLAAPVQFLTVALRPVVAVLTWVATQLVRTAARGSVPGPFVTEEELRMLVVMGEQQGVVEQEERQMMMGVLEMTDKPVREIMVPRVDVIGVEADTTVAEVIQIIIQHGHSRIPVYEDTIDNIVGVVYAKDLLKTHDEQKQVKTLARDAYFTPESKKVGELLHDMQVRTVHIAIVVDEYGGTAGIVTMEDLFEEIVGPIRDEYDIAEQEEIQFLSDHEALLSARVSIDDVREMLHLDIPEDTDADSIGGLVYERLGEIPKPGATITVGDARIIVETVRRQSIRAVRIVSERPLLAQPHNGRDEEPPREAHQ